MNKAELQADIASRAIAVIVDAQLEETVGNVNKYRSNVLERSAGKDRATARNIGWYVVDEGQAGEAAYYRDDESLSQSEQTLLDNYLDTIRGPGNDFQEVTILRTNRAERYSIARAYTQRTQGGDTNEVYILINFVSGSFRYSTITNFGG